MSNSSKVIDWTPEKAEDIRKLQEYNFKYDDDSINTWEPVPEEECSFTFKGVKY